MSYILILFRCPRVLKEIIYNICNIFVVNNPLSFVSVKNCFYAIDSAIQMHCKPEAFIHRHHKGRRSTSVTELLLGNLQVKGFSKRYSVRIWKNADQKTFEYEHVLCSVIKSFWMHFNWFSNSQLKCTVLIVWY